MRESRAFRSARKSRRCRSRSACGSWRRWAQGEDRNRVFARKKSARIAEQLSHRGAESRKVRFNHAPDDAIVYARVAVDDDVTKGNDSRMFGNPRRNFGIVFCKASEDLADDPELALDCGSQKFIGTVLLKASSRAECCNAVPSQLDVEETFRPFKPHKARSSPAPRAAGNRGYRGSLE